MIIWAKIFGAFNTVLQTVLITLKVTGQISWPWLGVLAPTLVPIFVAGVGALWIACLVLTHEK